MNPGIIANGFVGRMTWIFVKNYFYENDDGEIFKVLPDMDTIPVKPHVLASVPSTQRENPAGYIERI